MTTAALGIILAIGLPVLCGTIVALVAIIKGSSAIKSKQLDAEETRLLQEIHQSMSKLEKRIDALETLVIEHDQSSSKSPRQPTHL